MQIILKLIAAPFALAFVLGGTGVLMLAVQGDMFNGIALLVMGFALSPFGLPATGGG